LDRLGKKRSVVRINNSAEKNRIKEGNKKGSPEGAALFDASYGSAERRLRGLLEPAEQRLNHLRVLLVSG